MNAMPKQFPAAVVRDWGRLEIADVPALPLGPYDAVCRIEACSICAATDTHLVDGTFPRAWSSKPPFVLGHESAGHVVAVGEKVRRLKVGQLIVAPKWLPDGLSLGGFGSSWGGFASWGIARDTWAQAEDAGGNTDFWWRNALPLPEMPVRDATMFVTWRDTMSCLMQLGVTAGQRVAVFGTGANGLSFARFAVLRGAKVVIVGSRSRLDRAKRLGAICVDYHGGEKVPDQVREALGGGADVVIEAVGSGQGLPLMIRCLAERGKLFIFGIPGDLKNDVNVFDGPSEYSVVKKTADEWQSHGQVLTHYLTGEIKPEDLCDGEFPLEKINDAFAAIRRKEAVKLTIRMPH
jgi:threonine dehydrogenase-like Zn-dependent dehydrogenase